MCNDWLPSCAGRISDQLTNVAAHGRPGLKCKAFKGCSLCGCQVDGEITAQWLTTHISLLSCPVKKMGEQTLLTHIVRVEYNVGTVVARYLHSLFPCVSYRRARNWTVGPV